ncbi:hypothetical protein PHLGIDRAFT_106445 [Phlebiopsis gigantea 11061_1 CR5-6]|uniref:cAMP-independent regulatory protein pac2 n=1 Tax=Phlebiopsis gigantea (strain 11061_1 CR5-6) TaxID=745531 RepID=A0A0C3PKN8_PHLG1|nr:hypothetical protein PHLGIDRAFT_106445 [Phlebiopsis gigantea 11061_1 CR5-6]
MNQTIQAKAFAVIPITSFLLICFQPKFSLDFFALRDTLDSVFVNIRLGYKAPTGRDSLLHPTLLQHVSKVIRCIAHPRAALRHPPRATYVPSRPRVVRPHASPPDLRDARDAHIVFEAVRLNILPLITRRLTTIEREQLISGNVFVWEEAEHKQGGLERWTDGRRWSQSRMRGDYLFYEEKIEITAEERDAKAARRARRTLDPFSCQPAPVRRQDRPSKPDGLTKQTYSIQVQGSSYESPKKWHIVAYFSGDDYTRLPVVDNYEYLRNIRIPDGVFFAKGNQSRQNRKSSLEMTRESTSSALNSPVSLSIPVPEGSTPS